MPAHINNYKDFAAEMKEELESIPSKDRDRLLHSLYQLAEIKTDFERIRDRAQLSLEENRRARKSMLRVRSLLAQALQNIEEAHNNFGGSLKEIEDWWLSPPATFAIIIHFLRDSLEIADEMRFAHAAAIHPELRRGVESRDVEKLLGTAAIEPIFPTLSPARPKSPKIDHWFIAEAASSLRKWNTLNPERRVGRIDKIIHCLFKAAFNEHRSDENVRRELRQQTRRGTPSYSLS